MTDRTTLQKHSANRFTNGRLKRLVLCYRTVVLCVSLSVCDVGVLWPNTWMDQDKTFH